MTPSAPHIPLSPGARFAGKSIGGPYGDSIEELVWGVGQVMESLRGNGLDERTLVIFMSDNGPWYQGSAGGLRGRKGETYEGGMRVPFVARFPGRIPAGTVSRGLATEMDLLPTFARYTGAPLPARTLDGVDIGPVLSGERDEVARDVFLYFNGGDLQCARAGRWKVHFSRYLRTPWNPDPPGGCYNLPLPTPEVYDMVEDPSETYECSAFHASVVSDIRARLEAALATLPETARNSWNDMMRREVDYSPPGALPIRKRT
jgi:arylsulfatase